MCFGVYRTQRCCTGSCGCKRGIAGKSEYVLEVLKDVTREDIDAAEKMIARGGIKIALKENCQDRLYIEAICMNQNDTAAAVIQGTHTNIVSISRNQNLLYGQGKTKKKTSAPTGNNGYHLTLRSIWDYANQAELSEFEFLSEVIKVNCAIAEEGLKHEYGMGVGRHLYERAEKAENMDFQTWIVSYTAAAADARMAGCLMPVMATTGSGNHGLTASLPIIAASKWLKCSEELMYRALVYLQGGTYSQMEYAVKNMIADISGLVCDGAKAGCVLKIATSVAGAVQCSNLALDGIQVPDHDGIVWTDVEKTIRNLGNLGNQGMQVTDKVILDMMLEGQNE